MQTPTWYINRLRSMSFAEVVWRFRALARQTADRCLHERRKCPPKLTAIFNRLNPNVQISVRRETIGSHLLEAVTPEFLSDDRIATLVALAEAILKGRIHLLGAVETDVGTSPNWNYEYNARRDTPIGFAGSIDYRDYFVTGDCKWVWELNRHHHLVVLARAFRITGDIRYAATIRDQIESWIAACPFGCGMNWRSPLELAIRLINWVWALELIRQSSVIDPAFLERVYPIAYRHLWDVQRQYSQHSSANNHLIGEAAGVYIGATYFSALRDAPAWRSRARQLLIQEMNHQVNSDGGHKELATGYQLFVMQFFLLAGVVGRNTDDEFPTAYWQRLEKMFEFVAAQLEGGDSLPMFNDCDDGYVLDLGGVKGDARPLLGVAATLFDRGDFVRIARGENEPSNWLLGRASPELPTVTPESLSLKSRAFAETGLYLLQCGEPNTSSAVSLTMDCGPLGFGAIAAHGHADALSFVLRVGSFDFLVDPGTYDYFTDPVWRNYFRSTRAHNTIEIDGHDQSEIRGSFLWGRRAHARCLSWQDSGDSTRIETEHDGYHCLSDPVTHRRTIALSKPGCSIEIDDQIIGQCAHAVLQCLHFAPDCRVTIVGPQHIRAIRESVGIDLHFDPRMEVSAIRGDDLDPDSRNLGLGFVSRRYHERTSTTSVTASCKIEGAASLITRISAKRISTDPEMTSANPQGYNDESRGHQNRSECSSTPD